MEGGDKVRSDPYVFFLFEAYLSKFMHIYANRSKVNVRNYESNVRMNPLFPFLHVHLRARMVSLWCRGNGVSYHFVSLRQNSVRHLPLNQEKPTFRLGVHT